MLLRFVSAPLAFSLIAVADVTVRILPGGVSKPDDSQFVLSVSTLSDNADWNVDYRTNGLTYPVFRWDYDDDFEEVVKANGQVTITPGSALERLPFSYKGGVAAGGSYLGIGSTGEARSRMVSLRFSNFGYEYVGFWISAIHKNAAVSISEMRNGKTETQFVWLGERIISHFERNRSDFERYYGNPIEGVSGGEAEIYVFVQFIVPSTSTISEVTFYNLDEIHRFNLANIHVGQRTLDGEDEFPGTIAPFINDAIEKQAFDFPTVPPSSSWPSAECFSGLLLDSCLAPCSESSACPVGEALVDCCADLIEDGSCPKGDADENLCCTDYISISECEDRIEIGKCPITEGVNECCPEGCPVDFSVLSTCCAELVSSGECTVGGETICCPGLVPVNTCPSDRSFLLECCEAGVICTDGKVDECLVKPEDCPTVGSCPDSREELLECCESALCVDSEFSGCLVLPADCPTVCDAGGCAGWVEENTCPSDSSKALDCCVDNVICKDGSDSDCLIKPEDCTECKDVCPEAGCPGWVKENTCPSNRSTAFECCVDNVICRDGTDSDCLIKPEDCTEVCPEAGCPGWVKENTCPSDSSKALDCCVDNVICKDGSDSDCLIKPEDCTECKDVCPEAGCPGWVEENTCPSDSSKAFDCCVDNVICTDVSDSGCLIKPEDCTECKDVCPEAGCPGWVKENTCPTNPSTAFDCCVDAVLCSEEVTENCLLKPDECETGPCPGSKSELLECCEAILCDGTASDAEGCLLNPSNCPPVCPISEGEMTTCCQDHCAGLFCGSETVRCGEYKTQ